MGGIEIDFNGVQPSCEIRNKMKAVKYRWNPNKMIWWAYKNDNTVAVAKEICGDSASIAPDNTAAQTAAINVIKKRTCKVPSKDYALKLKIKDIVSADKAQFEVWEQQLKDYVNEVMSEDNSDHEGNSVSKSQEFVWMNCFVFISKTLNSLSQAEQEYSLVFEYSLPGTVHERPDVFLLTNKKAISLEFKRKEAPQIDDNKDDIAQAIRYKEWLQNHHKVTKDRDLDVKSYLVCTHRNANSGELRGITILNADNFCNAIHNELMGENLCTFENEWYASPKTEMPDMLQAIEIMYREGRIPYISDVNKTCLDKVLWYIEDAKKKHKKILILINGVPGAGKTAVGQSIVYEENKNGNANAVYLSGNGPLVEVLQYQINQVGANKHIAENTIQGMKEFKSSYFFNDTKVPEQSILIFDEAQRAWDAEKLGRGLSEPEGLFRVGEKIFNEREYAVLIGLYGNGKVIYKGEEKGLSLWEEALKEHDDWIVIASEELASKIQGLDDRRITDNDVFLPVSLRADFIDCSKWVEQAINRNNMSLAQAKKELEELQKTSMRICVTRSFEAVKNRVVHIDEDHPEWNYGMLISNFAEQSVIRKALPGWNIGYNGQNVVANGGYGKWFAGESMKLDKACSVYGSQGLELDCPIVIFGGGYVRKNNQWISRGYRYDTDVNKGSYLDPDSIVENNFRVLLTRARKEMILLIPQDSSLDETYQYFLDMGMDVLEDNGTNDVENTVMPKKRHPVTNKIYRTASGRVISYYGIDAGAAIYSIDKNEEITLNDFFEIMLKSWVKESAYPSAQKDPQFNLANDPTYGQCAVTAMLVNKFFGGEIRKIRVSGGGTHYFNVINGQVFDLTRDQFDLYNLPVDYSSSINVPIEYCGKNANTKARYDILEKNVIKKKEVYCNE